MNAALQNHGKTGRNTERNIALANGTYGASNAPRDESLDWDAINAANSANAFSVEEMEVQTARSSRMAFMTAVR
jgi:hypothetical protein